uniref:Pescadillo homolog n=1 Tax=Rhodosorus marinus TaxID=101924 RepID=A0A7S2ZN03_9RHOD|mmetsp:Transcript_25419/g.100356  ORF Transcript_25419/g.100356 Transcript_25419/m.100356 type:complete len:534 (+) Transcript_25419:391-1992(+)
MCSMSSYRAGIYPREPKKKFDGVTKTYYLTKDIQFLLHEPVLGKIREIRAYRQKIKRARAKKEYGTLKTLLRNKPTYKIDHIVRERYPTFSDALRDMDDALSLVHMFQHLPSEKSIKPHRIRNCERLAKEFQNYVATTGSLDKVFVSVKGIYYSARIGGERAVWVEPHRFTQELPKDVDYRVMLTFLEFYECLLSFVNYRLYTTNGMPYPPKMDPIGGKDDQPDVEADRAHHVQENIAQILKKQEADEDDDDDSENDDEEELQMEEEETQQAKDGTEGKEKLVFSGLKVFLGRETPVSALEFVLRAQGAKVGWDGENSPFTSDERGLTHWVIDRPAIPGKRRMDLEYVQPQWVFDSVNNSTLLPTSIYGIGVTLPPHLSPFVDDVAEGYVPKYKAYLQRLKDGDPELFKETALAVNDDSEEDMDDLDNDDDNSQKEEAESKHEDGSSDSEDEDEDEEMEEDLAKDMAEMKEEGKKQSEELAKLMMSRKKRNLYERMVHGKNRKSDQVRKLEERRDAIETKKAKKRRARSETNQ